MFIFLAAWHLYYSYRTFCINSLIAWKLSRLNAWDLTSKDRSWSKFKKYYNSNIHDGTEDGTIYLEEGEETSNCVKIRLKEGTHLPTHSHFSWILLVIACYCRLVFFYFQIALNIQFVIFVYAIRFFAANLNSLHKCHQSMIEFNFIYVP